MKSRVSFVLSKEVFEELDSITEHYRNSAVVEGIIKDYIEAKDYTEVKSIQRGKTVTLSFTIDFDLMEQFRKCYPVCKWNKRNDLDRPDLSQSLEYLLKKYLEINRIETN